MGKIKVEKMCSCAKKRKSWQDEILCENFDTALQKASTMCEQANSKFCKKHRYKFKIEPDLITIQMDASR